VIIIVRMNLPHPLDGAAVLDDLGLIRAQGEDAATFLHGQLTHDFSHLAADQARLAGYCSPKGRLLATFVAWKVAPDDILLLCSADLLAPTLKRLSMFVMRAKCKLADATPDFQRIGLAGPAALQWLGNAAPSTAWGTALHGQATVVRLPAAAEGAARFVWVAKREVPAPALPALELSTWQRG
jgi:folate-binding Fe-S cluster repair protein YgfZ